jgi:hypothetical protein
MSSYAPSFILRRLHSLPETSLGIQNHPHQLTPTLKPDPFIRLYKAQQQTWMQMRARLIVM